MLRCIFSMKKEALLNGSYSNSTYRVHLHANSMPLYKLLDGVELKNCYQIRISKFKGGIHGIFNENIFYVI